MITLFHLEQGRLVQTKVEGALEAFPAELVWVDLLNPSSDEERMMERVFGIEVPTRDEMQEIETSSRLYVEDEALFMTMAVLNKPTTDEPETASVTFILHKNRLMTVRYIEPLSFGLFMQRIKRQPFLVPSGDQVLLGLLEQIAGSLADILEGSTADLEGLSRTIFSTSRSTSVAKTMGRWPSLAAASLISATTACALSAVSMNGRRTWRGLIENCARMELPKVSAVMPVPSDTK